MFEVIHTAVEPASFVAPSDAGRPAPSRPTVLFVGRVDQYKGVLAVAEAILRLRSAYPAILYRIVGGGDEGTLARLRAMIAAAGAESSFEIVGFAEYAALGRYYAACDVFASPAPQEHGVATVYLEAMSAGKPVVACTTGGAPEAVIDGLTGLLVPPGDVDALVDALDRLVARPDLRQQLGENGRRRVHEYFAAERMVDRLEAVYRRLVVAAGRGDAVADERAGDAPPAGVA